MPRTFRLAAMVTALGSTSCALVTATPPGVAVMDGRLTGIGLTEQQLALTLCVTNPNASELALRHVTAALDVAGAPLGAGSSDLPVTLPPHSSVAVPFTVVTTTRNLGPQLLGILQSGEVSYRVHGTVSLQGSFGFAIPYSRSGRFDLLAGSLNLAAMAADPAPSSCTPVAAGAPT